MLIALKMNFFKVYNHTFCYPSLIKSNGIVAMFFLLFLLPFKSLFAQPLVKPEEPIVVSYSSPETFEVEEVKIEGNKYLDANALIALTSIKQGDKITIPGEQITNAIKKLWEQGLIADVQVNAKKVDEKKVNIYFAILERPRLSGFEYVGVRKGEREDLAEKMDISKGRIVNDPLLKNAKKKAQNFFIEKGFLNTQVNITQKRDSLLSNNVVLKVQINKNKRVRIKEIDIVGNDHLKDAKLRRKMKKTKQKKWYAIFTSSKLIKKEYDKDKESLIEYYNAQGYRDAAIVYDSVKTIDEKYVKLNIKIDEGRKYYFRNISWTGNYIYDSKTLSNVLNIKKGDVYNIETLQKRLSYNPQGYDVSSLYLDDGYLFFNVEPVEVMIDGDSIDIEMRINEGPQATIDRIYLTGNTKTHDHVILREVRTHPGQKFSRSDLIRSTRELAALNYFDQEALMTNGVTPVPNPQKGTVDIHYKVTEKPSDQIELSGGYGGFYGLIGTLGLTFNNFSARNITKLSTWSPLPSGDGQRVSLRFQANGRNFQNYSISFTEPWLGGSKPMSLTVALSHSRSFPNRIAIGGLGRNNFGGAGLGGFNSFGTGFGNNFNTFGGGINRNPDTRLLMSSISVSLGQRLRWPDDYFSLSNGVTVMQYNLRAYDVGLGFKNGTINNLSFINTLSRNSIDDFTFPTSGSTLSLSLSLTPPYSLFNKINYSDVNLDPSVRYKWMEYHKWMFDNTWYATLVPGKKRNLVFAARTHFGFISSYRRTTGIGPFERFVMGGSGLSGFNFLLGTDIIGLRGYGDRTLNLPNGGGTVYNKLVAEVRYPIQISPAFSLFVLSFFEAGNTWANFQDYNPFNLYRSVGVGARIFMPAFGMIGIDYGKALDFIPGLSGGGQSAFTFTIGQQIR
jgi:outer membrane protein insertion porin family